MTTLLIDSLSICHAAKHAMKRYPLSTDEMRTEVIFVFLQKTLTLARRFNTNKFVFAWDSRKSFRQKLYPKYKANRHKTDYSDDEKFFNRMTHDQFSVIRRRILPEMGFVNNFIQTGYEADDIIAGICHNETSDECVIVSTDTDLYQLIRNNISQFNHITNKRFFVVDFQKKWGIAPYDWGMVKAIAGCSTDNVKGIKGVGEKTAIKFIKGELGKKTKTFANIKNGYDTIVKRNIPLVVLPMDGAVTFPIKEDELHISKFLSVFKQLEFQSFLKKENMKKWQEAFGL